MAELITQSILKYRLRHEKHTGIFCWIDSKNFNINNNTTVGSFDGKGYNRSNNRINNLRESPLVPNQKNRSIGKNNKSATLVVRKNYYDENKWDSFTGANGKSIKLGTLNAKEEAIKCRKDAEIKCGYHENHGDYYGN